MSSNYNNNNKGSLWKAEKKTKNGDSYYTGTAIIDGVDYYINLFKNKSENPKAPLMKITFTKKNENVKNNGNNKSFNNDDVPF